MIGTHTKQFTENMQKKSKKQCLDCGSAPVNHKLMYTSILLGALIDPWTGWMGKIFSESSLEWIGPGLTKTLTFLHIGKITHEPKDDDSARTRVLWEEAKARGIDMYEFRLFGIGHDIFVSNYKGESRFFDVLPRPKDYNPNGLQWMDNKNEMKKHFKAAGDIPLAEGAITYSLNKALTIFRTLSKPVITKPNIGSRSRHTTTHITNEEQFIVAFKKARQLSPWVMIEEELSGFVFRGTLINKKLEGVLRREPAYVTGDGIHTVRELIDIENSKPLRHGPLFHTVGLDEEALKELAHFKRTPDTIPKKDEVITLGQKTSRGVGGGITDVTEHIHPDNKKMLEKVAEVLDDPLIGVDFIMDDVSISWKDQPRSGVIECNSAPFIDLHHFPLVGKPRNLAAKLWDIIYPSSKKDA
jgi:cyanophycin synthetase